MYRYVYCIYKTTRYKYPQIPRITYTDIGRHIRALIGFDVEIWADLSVIEFEAEFGWLSDSDQLQHMNARMFLVLVSLSVVYVGFCRLLYDNCKLL